MLLNKNALSNSLKKGMTIIVPAIVLGVASVAIVHAESADKKAAIAQELKSELDANGITPEQYGELHAQLLAEGKTPEEANAQIKALLQKPKVAK